MRRFPSAALSSLALAVALGLSACASPDDWKVDPVRDMANAGGPFDTALQAGYAALAQAELDEGDWSDARHFIALTRAAAEGKRPEPDRIEDRALPAATVADLTAARAALMDVYKRSGRILAPLESAEAQIQFDCWIQEQEENIPAQADEVAACRTGFEEALAAARGRLSADTVALLPDLDGGVGEVIISPKNPKAAPVTLANANAAAAVVSQGTPQSKSFTLADQDIQEIWGKTLAAQPIPPKRFQLYFLSGGTELTPESLALLPAIAADAEGRPVREIEILGHTDRVGNDQTNARLSAKRAESVRDLLISKGFKAAEISTRGFGESMPLVSTADNVPEARNRRVEIIVR